MEVVTKSSPIFFIRHFLNFNQRNQISEYFFPIVITVSEDFESILMCLKELFPHELYHFKM